MKLQAELASARKDAARMRIALQSIENHELRDHEDYTAIKDIASAELSGGYT
jgi:hypothetical protein